MCQQPRSLRCWRPQTSVVYSSFHYLFVCFSCFNSLVLALLESADVYAYSCRYLFIYVLCVNSLVLRVAGGRRRQSYTLLSIIYLYVSHVLTAFFSALLEAAYVSRILLLSLFIYIRLVCSQPRSPHCWRPQTSVGYFSFHYLFIYIRLVCSQPRSPRCWRPHTSFGYFSFHHLFIYVLSVHSLVLRVAGGRRRQSDTSPFIIYLYISCLFTA